MWEKGKGLIQGRKAGKGTEGFKSGIYGSLRAWELVRADGGSILVEQIA